MMVGRSVLLRVEKKEAKPGAAVLEVENLHVRDSQKVRRVNGVSFKVHQGEILGIAGVAGNGQSELLEALAGIRTIESGRILLRGEDLTKPGAVRTAKTMRELGLAHVPEERLKMGLVESFQASESGILGHHREEKYTGRILTHGRAILDDVGRQMKAFDVRPPDPTLLTANFSGGNQQKIVLVREIDPNPDILLVGQPTRGVDIGAIEFIHRRLIEMRDEGKAILLVSVELDEILSLSDRILVMFNGEIVGEIPQASATETQLGLMMAGERLPAEAVT
jgi:simple sugar transport system ATP-binding protein